jgi:hypothetical protein
MLVLIGLIWGSPVVHVFMTALKYKGYQGINMEVITQARPARPL